MLGDAGLSGLIAENADLRERLSLLSEAVENVRHGLCMFDDRGRIAYCNRRYAEVIGLPADKVRPGVSARELVAMGMEAGFYAEGRTLDDVEEEFWRNLSRDPGNAGQVHRRGRAYVVHPGRTATGKYVATFEDITAQLNAEKALRQSEARLSAILDAMPDCVKIFDRVGRIVYINPKGLELLETPDLETLIASGHMPVPSEHLPQCLAVHERVLGGEPVVWTYEIVGMSGRRRHVEAHAVPFDMPDGTRAHLSITRDITERQQAEDALRRSEERLRLIQDAVGLADFENNCGKISVCSDSFFDQVGLPRGDNTITLERWFELVHPDDRASQRRAMDKALAEADLFDAEYRIVRPDNGETRWISCRTKILRDEHGRPARVIGAHLDVTTRRESEDTLRRNEEHLRLVQEATGLASFEANSDGVARVSQAMIEQLGLPAGTAELPFERLLDFVHPEDRNHLEGQVMTSLVAQETFDLEFRIVHGVTGETRWIHSRTTMERDENGVALRSIGAHLDITERKLADEALRESEERFRLAAEAAGLGVWDYDALLGRREWSDRLCEIFGISTDAPSLFETAAKCVCSDHEERFLRQFEALKAGSINRFVDSFRIERADDGRQRWIAVNGWRTDKADSRSRRLIVTVRDITDEKTAEERIRWSASHDPLTGLANRVLFQEKLEAAVTASEDEGSRVGVLMLDLDHFKQINDSLGHEVGDALLRMFADRLNGAVRGSDTVARLGGDEFVVVLPGLDTREEMVELVSNIHRQLRAPFVHGGRVLDCRVSGGASLFPDNARSPAEILKNADAALYSAKTAGRARMAMFGPQMREDLQRRASMVQLARNAIERERIIPYYQPKVNLDNGAIHGFEALLRWQMPDGRIGLPSALEAAFEDLEVAASISDRMIQKVIDDMRGWLDRGIEFHHVAVNACAAEFRGDDFAERLLEKLERSQVPTRCFQLEVTETVFLGRGAECVHRALARLSSEGIEIALDDFGTGYASLRHLKEFPVDIIKIDQSFVRDLDDDLGDEAIVRAVINLGQSLGIAVVAEGIETGSSAERLIELGCDFGQGFLFSKAVPAKCVPELSMRFPAEISPATKSHPRPGSRRLQLVAGAA